MWTNCDFSLFRQTRHPGSTAIAGKPGCLVCETQKKHSRPKRIVFNVERGKHPVITLFTGLYAISLLLGLSRRDVEMWKNLLSYTERIKNMDKSKSPSWKRCEIVSNLQREDGTVLFDLENMQKVLFEKTGRSIKDYAYIIHDKDTYTAEDEEQNTEHKAGALKPAHIHLLLRFKDSQKIGYVADWFGISPNFINKIKKRWENAVLYQTHANAPEKYQYSSDEVTCNFDYNQVCQRLKNKSALDEILERILHGEIAEYEKTEKIDNMLLVKHTRPIEDAFKVYSERLQLHREGNRQMTCIYIVGKSGVAKSSLAKKIAKNLGLSYFVSSSSNDPLYGYKQQECIILDEIRPSTLSFGDLLKFLDPHHASSARSRYHNKTVDNCRLIILTTILDMDSFYNNLFMEQPEPLIQLKRRCKYYIYMDERYIEISEFDEKAMRYGQPRRYKNTVLEEIMKKASTEENNLKLDDLVPFLGSPVQSEDNSFTNVKEKTPFDNDKQNGNDNHG